MGIQTSLANVVPWNLNPWRSTSSEPSVMPTYDEEALDERRPILHLDITSPLSLSEPTPTQMYGATRVAESPSAMSLPAAHRNTLLRVLEEDTAPDMNDSPDPSDDGDDALDWELEKYGLYRGSYFRIVALYTLVPLSSGIAFLLLALLQIIVYPSQLSDTYPHPKNFPFPFSELLTSASLWSLSHLLRVPLHSIFLSLLPSSTLAVILSTTCHMILHNLLRLAAFPLLLLRHHMAFTRPTWHDPTFRRVWWIALGWSFAEVVVGIVQGYDQISLYRDVLVPPGRDEEFYQQLQNDVSPGSPFCLPSAPTNGVNEREAILNSSTSTSATRGETKGKHIVFPVQTTEHSTSPRNGESASRFGEPLPFILEGPPQLQVDRDLDQLMALRGREEVEEVYGIPAIRIPVFISCLVRFNSIILSLGLTLLVSASYLSSSMSNTGYVFSLNYLQVLDGSANPPFLITFPVVIAIHLFLAFLHTPLVVPRIGVHVSAYIGLLVSLGCFFAGLSMWEALS